METFLESKGFSLATDIDDFYSLMQPRIENFIAYEKQVSKYSILAERGLGILSKNHWVISVYIGDGLIGKVEILTPEQLSMFLNIYAINL